MTRNDLDLTADIIDIRDIIARVEELEDETKGIRSGSLLNPSEFLKAYRGFHYPNEGYSDPVLAEFAALTAILDDLKGAGGDEQWEGEWYPLILIRASYFKDYAQELAEECGMVNSQATWPNNCIDWDLAARELKHDYNATDISGATYYFR